MTLEFMVMLSVDSLEGENLKFTDTSYGTLTLGTCALEPAGRGKSWNVV
jgi:hypothetical protein